MLAISSPNNLSMLNNVAIIAFETPHNCEIRNLTIVGCFCFAIFAYTNLEKVTCNRLKEYDLNRLKNHLENRTLFFQLRCCQGVKNLEHECLIFRY